MIDIHFYFDFISPYAWLAFKALPQSLEGISHRVHYHPVVFGAMLKHHGNWALQKCQANAIGHIDK